jgi:GTPase
VNTPSAPGSAPFRAGTVAIIGRPNVGKSTLLNALLGAKVSITSRKPQTTRHRIVGVLTRPNAQLCFFDTPGYQTKHNNTFNSMLNKTVSSTANEADVVVLVMDAKRWTPADAAVIKRINSEKPLIIAVNKADLFANKNALLPLLAQLHELAPHAQLVPVSAAKNMKLDTLADAIEAHLPEGEALYDVDTLTDRDERFLATELVREKVFRLMGDEIPYDCTVVIDQFLEEPTGRFDQGDPIIRRVIHASILVERETQKPIVLGEGGERLKRIGSEARIDMQKLFGAPVHLELWVRVKSGWADTEQSLRSYGYS